MLVHRTRQHCSETLFTTVVSLEEHYAGRIAQISKATYNDLVIRRNFGWLYLVTLY